ncbi:hypothetical protein C1H46_032705 [Malus baccata]|uniref:Uncharacterized protein n=1 Tax=Malus baccata TaxID=106549 RepID=A0A540L5K8_MALBA|nr:hypothetical protein C1H46_032705 [Malus baccata]
MCLDRWALIINWISDPLPSLTSHLPTGIPDLHRGQVLGILHNLLASPYSHMLLCIYFAGTLIWCLLSRFGVWLPPEM